MQPPKPNNNKTSPASAFRAPCITVPTYALSSGRNKESYANQRREQTATVQTILPTTQFTDRSFGVMIGHAGPGTTVACATLQSIQIASHVCLYAHTFNKWRKNTITVSSGTDMSDQITQTARGIDDSSSMRPLDNSS